MGKILKSLSDKMGKMKAKLGKKSQLLLAGILAIILLIIFFDGILSGKNASSSDASVNPVEEEQAGDLYVENLETRIEAILSSLSSVSKVEAFIMTETSVQTIYATDETKDTDSSDSGINSASSSVEIVFSKNGSVSNPIVAVEIYPEIVGVLIVAEAGGDEKTRLMLINAVAVALNVENSKIEVLLTGSK